LLDLGKSAFMAVIMRTIAIILGLSVPFLTVLADERLPELPSGEETYHNVTVTCVTATDFFSPTTGAWRT
jgi:hypothetical protein